SALTWLHLSTPSPERPGTEPPKSRLATTSACISCGATNCAAPLPSLPSLSSANASLQ
ncbi:hypothetical protein C8A03DRAFT_13344, partial [Achaetomium macrosporum]